MKKEYGDWVEWFTRNVKDKDCNFSWAETQAMWAACFVMGALGKKPKGGGER